MINKKVLYIALLVLLVIGLGIVVFASKNTPIIAHFLNKNSISIDVDEELQLDKIKLELSIESSSVQDRIIAQNGQTKSIPKGYGENDWRLIYDDKYYASFRHFKTNNWHDHHYSFSFYKAHGNVYCNFQIDGPDEMGKQRILLDEITDMKQTDDAPPIPPRPPGVSKLQEEVEASRKARDKKVFSFIDDLADQCLETKADIVIAYFQIAQDGSLITHNFIKTDISNPDKKDEILDCLNQKIQDENLNFGEVKVITTARMGNASTTQMTIPIRKK